MSARSSRVGGQEREKCQLMQREACVQSPSPAAILGTHRRGSLTWCSPTSPPTDSGWM